MLQHRASSCSQMALGRTAAACWHAGHSHYCLPRSGTGLRKTSAPLQHSSRPPAVCSYKADSGAQEEPQQPAQPRLPQLPQPQLVEGKDLQLLELRLERKLDQVVNAVDGVQKDVAAVKTSVAEIRTSVAEVRTSVAEVKKDLAEVRLIFVCFAVLVAAIFGYKEVLPFLKVI